MHVSLSFPKDEYIVASRAAAPQPRNCLWRTSRAALNHGMMSVLAHIPMPSSEPRALFLQVNIHLWTANRRRLTPASAP
jgi:hypothetical protein